jgi:UDP-N-acetylglucosamine/UDP-N-acetylgalactosamine diphosphorylase
MEALKQEKMTPEEFLSFLEGNNQYHILDHYQRLDLDQKRDFLAGLAGLDLGRAFQLYREFSEEKTFAASPPDIEPAPIIPVPQTPEEKVRRGEIYRFGESLIQGGQVAVMIVAGGQGTRLGFSGPKGHFPISPVRNKPLFQLFAEAIRTLSLRYRAVIPLLIMTSQETQVQTREFFEGNRFFGLEEAQVHFFNQATLPTLTPQGKLILKDARRLLTNPDGHGGSLKALYGSGLLQFLKDEGYTELFYCQVDNPLVKIADPVFLGYHRLEKADVSTKVVRRQNLEEKVGIYVRAKGRPAVIEYSDLPLEDYRALDGKGNILYWAGNIGIHVFSLAFVEALNRQGFALPYHRAIKDVGGIGPDGREARMTAWKFETFVFDSIPLAEKSFCLEVKREEEFAPVKNQTGIDSPETSREAMNRLFRSWLREAGSEVAPGVQVEISPLFALDKGEFVDKMKGKRLLIQEDWYLE